MREYVFDLSSIRSLEDWWTAYTEVVRGEGWEMFGRKRDAYRDSLAGGPGCPLTPSRFIFTNLACLPDEVVRSATELELRAKLKSCHPSHIPNLEAQINLLQYGIGETLLNWIIDPTLGLDGVEVVVRAGV